MVGGLCTQRLGWRGRTDPGVASDAELVMVGAVTVVYDPPMYWSAWLPLWCTSFRPYLGVVSLERAQDRRTSDAGGSGGASIGGTPAQCSARPWGLVKANRRKIAETSADRRQ